MPEHKISHERQLEPSERSVEEMLITYDALDSEYLRLTELWSAAKTVLTRPMTAKLANDLDRLEQELAALHDRQHAILRQQDEIERQLIARARA